MIETSSDRIQAFRPSSRFAGITVFAALIALMFSHSSYAVLVSAVLPTSRSVEVNQPVTVFATLLNAGTEEATNCQPALGTAVDVTLAYQTTNPATNAPTGLPNTPANVAANAGVSWVLTLTANATFAPTELIVDFNCDNVDPPQNIVGINTVLISASIAGTADIVALSATLSGNGIVATAPNQPAAFSVATVNVGSTASITAKPSATGAPLDGLSICQTDPSNAQCLSAPASEVTLLIAEAETPTFSVFLQSAATIDFRPAENRVTVEFSEADVRRGSTSVALDIRETVPTQSAPNILLVISDDQGLDASAQYPFSNDPPSTPTLDTLANNGLTFDNAWATPSCTTTRATMLTGQFGINSGITSTPGRIEPGEQILQATVQSTTNYATAVFGKWHVAGANPEASHPNDLGVGYYAGNLRGNLDDYYDWDLTINGSTERTSEYHTSKITQLASDWIQAQTTPWFAWVAYSAPHSPFHLPPEELQSTGLPGGADHIAANRREYYLAAIEALDTEMGALLTSLPEDERDNTIIIYIGDNGTPRNVLDNTVYITPHAKGSLYQGGVAVPLVVSGAGVTRQGQRESALVATSDVFATVLDLIGSTAAAPSDSESFAATFSEQDSAARSFSYAEIESSTVSGWAVRNDAHKLIVFSDGSEELYELALDTDEQNNLLPGDVAITQIRDELHAFGLMTRGEGGGSSGSPIDITDTLFTNRSANCADYIASYNSDVLDVNNDVRFEGDLVISVVDDKCVFTTNLIPNHDFNDGATSFPNQVAPQNEAYSLTTSPGIATLSTALSLTSDNAVLLNGVKVDLLAAGCFGVGDGRVGCNDINQPWRFDPLFPASGFRVDSHNAHTQPNGGYHYHGPPNALYSNTAEAVSPLIGFAADGFPIFGSFIEDSGTIREVQSSYQLRSGDRPSDAGDPGGAYDGTYRDDYEYVEGSGDLDECNGRVENGVYGYYVTLRFPYILGCFSGTPDSSFNK